MAFDWERLLDQDRRRRTTKVPEDKRSEFERDYDRLVSSSSLRRLQDKTQVFPLEHP
jgi:dGTPase